MEPGTVATAAKAGIPLVQKLLGLLKWPKPKTVFIVQDLAGPGAVSVWHLVVLDNGYTKMHFQGFFHITNQTDAPLTIAEVDCKPRPSASRIYHVNMAGTVLAGAHPDGAQQYRYLGEDGCVVPARSLVRVSLFFGLDPAPKWRGDLKLKLLITDNTGKRHKVQARFQQMPGQGAR